MNSKITLLTVFLILTSTAFTGLAVADEHSPVDEITGENSDNTGLAKAVDMIPEPITEKVKSAAEWTNSLRYKAKAMIADDADSVSAAEQANQTRSTFNENSTEWVDWYNNQSYPASSNWTVFELVYDDGDTTETDYLVLEYNSTSDEYTAATIHDEYDAESDATVDMDGPLVDTVDDRREAHELVDHVHEEFVTENKDISEADGFIKQLGKDYTGHVESELF